MVIFRETYCMYLQFCYIEWIEKRYFCSHLKIISASKFYSSKNPSRYTTLLDARSDTEASNLINTVILPPNSSNLDIDSNIDEYSEQLNVETALFESAGRLVNEESKRKNCSDNGIMRPQKPRNDNPRRRKSYTFSKEIPTTRTSNLCYTLPCLITKRLFDLRSSFIGINLWEILL